MIIQCQSCDSKYFLPESKMPTAPLKVRCPRCQAVFTLVPRVESVASGRGGAAAPPEAEAAPRGTAGRPQPGRKHKGGADGGPDARARRLARVLVSDILCYNREKRDQALIDGNLITVLGEEIKKSWELYKEKVGEETANSSNYFKEALNEILADGQKVF